MEFLIFGETVSFETYSSHSNVLACAPRALRSSICVPNSICLLSLFIPLWFVSLLEPAVMNVELSICIIVIVGYLYTLLSFILGRDYWVLLYLVSGSIMESCRVYFVWYQFMYIFFPFFMYMPDFKLWVECTCLPSNV